MPETQRLKLLLSYDGTPFAGWQRQQRARTIQGELEDAFARICGQALTVHGAGRTDAGVHALGQCAHVDVPRTKLSLSRWHSALHSYLPPTIRVLKIVAVPNTFEARFSAQGKTYRYRIVTGETLSPFEIDRAWHLRSGLDESLFRKACAVFPGRHDFAAFAANRGHPPKETVRTITQVKLVCRRELVQLEISGDGFLYKMVRLIVGAAVRCATGRGAISDLDLQLRDGRVRSERLVAPAAGLYLLRVRY